MIESLIQKLATQASIDIVIRVRPHAPKSQITSVLEDGSVKVDLAAPAEDNRANISLINVLAESFSVPASHIKILSGKTARMKLVRITSAQS